MYIRVCVKERKKVKVSHSERYLCLVVYRGFVFFETPRETRAQDAKGGAVTSETVVSLCLSAFLLSNKTSFYAAISCDGVHLLTPQKGQK